MPANFAKFVVVIEVSAGTYIVVLSDVCLAKVNPTNADSLCQCGMERKRERDLEGAITLLASAVRHDPRHVAAIMSLETLLELKADGRGL